MFGYRQLSIETLTSLPWLVWPALVILAGLAVWLYRRTNPPLPVWRRVLLAALRLTAVTAIIIALLEPVVGFSRTWQRPFRISLLLDYSHSMDRQEQGLTRTARRDSLLSSPSLSQLKSRADVSTWYFADRLSDSPEKLDRDKTALGDVLFELIQEELGAPADYWVLLSDGNANTGRQVNDAAKGLPTPVLAVNMAQQQGAFDVQLDDVEYNRVLFAGQPSEIKVRLKWRDAEGRNLKVQLKDGDRALAEKPFPIQQPDGFGDVMLRFTPDAPGQKLLTLTVPPMKGEQATGNNQQTLPVKVLKSRSKVLLVSESADYELGFLTRFLRQSDKYDVTLVLTGQKVGNLSGHFPAGQTELNRYDLVLLYDPDPRRIETSQRELQSYLKDRSGAVWLLMGPHYAAAAPAPWLDSLLPFAPSHQTTIAYTEVRAEPVEGQLFHPALRLGDDRAAIRATWRSVPPFRMWLPCDSIHPQAVTLAFAAGRGQNLGRFPLMGYRRFGGGKVFATAAGPFWTWGFVGLGVNEPVENYARFLEGVLSWLTTPEDYAPLAIQPERKVYNRGETIKFLGHAFDQGYRPLPGVSGIVSLTDETGGERFEADLIDKGNGAFEAEFTGLPPGTYRYDGRFEKGGTLLKKSSGRLRVERHSLEEANPGGMPANLQAIARLSGGKYINWPEFDQAIIDLDPHPLQQTSRAEFTLWGKTWLLLLIVGALSLEWLTRKLNQLL